MTSRASGSEATIELLARSGIGWIAPSCLISASVKSLAQNVGRNAVEHHGAPPIGELWQGQHIGGCDQIRFVARNEVSILGGHEIRLDIVRAELDAQRIRLQRVLGKIATAAAAVTDHQWRRLVVAMRSAIVCLDEGTAKQQATERQAAGDAVQCERKLHQQSPCESRSCDARVTSP
jgi:hypothetical protein